MVRILLIAGMIFFCAAISVAATGNLETDQIKTAEGELTITFIGHGSLMFSANGKVIYIDPVAQMGDYTKLPKANLILVTHEHSDHFDAKAIMDARTDKTEIVTTENVARQFPIPGGIVMKNGDVRTVQGFKVEAVPAYNLVHMRSPGVPYHPKGAGNGYIVTIGGKKIYVAGDTENTPEMKALRGIDIAFLPMNLPYTMTPEMVADAAKAFRPKILYPYHYGNTDTSIIVDLLKDEKDIAVRIRRMK